jgi:hypothetical protein
VKVFRLTVEFELEDDLNLVVGTVFSGVGQFDGTVHVSLERVEKFSGLENDDDDDSGE